MAIGVEAARRLTLKFSAKPHMPVRGSHLKRTFLDFLDGLGACFSWEALAVDKFEKVKRTNEPNHTLLIGDDNVMYLVLSHDSSCNRYVVICGNRVDTVSHEATARRIVLQPSHQVGGRNDAQGLIFRTHNRQRAYAVSFHQFAGMADRVMLLDDDHPLRHDV